MKKGKRYNSVKEKIEKGTLYSIEDAVKKMKDIAAAKFDETIEIAVRLGVNPTRADQMVRGSVVLPKGTGKKVRVLVIAKGEKVKEATDAGADIVGSDDMIEKIKGGWLEFDRVVATPDMMGSVGKLGKILGPRGLMPNPKSGTVTFEIGKAVKDIRAGEVEFRVEKAGVVHAPLGKASFKVEDILANVMSFLDVIVKLKPSSAKGK